MTGMIPLPQYCDRWLFLALKAECRWQGGHSIPVGPICVPAASQTPQRSSGMEDPLILLQRGLYANAITVLEEMELQNAEDTLANDTFDSYDYLLFAYCAGGKLQLAQLLWDRLPTPLKAQPLFQCLHNILDGLWNGQFSLVQSALQQLEESNRLPVDLVRHVRNNLEDQVLRLIESSFEAISEERIGLLLGRGFDEILSARLIARTWSPSENSGFWCPCKVASSAQNKVQRGEDVVDLSMLASMAAMLESSGVEMGKP